MLLLFLVVVFSPLVFVVPSGQLLVLVVTEVSSISKALVISTSSSPFLSRFPGDLRTGVAGDAQDEAA